MAGEIYNFLPIPEVPRPQNDANQQIADSLYQFQTEQVLQPKAGWDGLFGETLQPITLSTTPTIVDWETTIANRFGDSVFADVSTDSMLFKPGVYSNAMQLHVIVSNPSGTPRILRAELISQATQEVLVANDYIIEKQVEELNIIGSWLAQAVEETTLGIYLSVPNDPGFDIGIRLRHWEAFAISPLGYVPPNPLGAGRGFTFGMAAQLPLGFFGGMSRDIASGLAPLQSVTGPVPVGGFDVIKADRSAIATLPTASIEVDSDGIWDVNFSLNGMVQINRRYLFVVWLNGVRTECGAVADTSNQTDEISITGRSLFNLVIGDELQLQIESPNGPSDWESEFGSFTVFKVGEAP